MYETIGDVIEDVDPNERVIERLREIRYARRRTIMHLESERRSGASHVPIATVLRLLNPANTNG